MIEPDSYIPGDSYEDAVFSVVDVETTGSMPSNDRIIEFAAYKVHMGKIVDEYSTLINPGRHIPNFIRNMTGITNEMVYSAPTFNGAAVKIAEFLQGTVFVAHNAQFDYGFVRSEMERLGLDFDLLQLCTRKLSSRILTSLPRKALDQVCHYLGIRINNRHRAFGDARATAHLLIELLEMIGEKHEISTLDELLRFQNVAQRIDPHRNQNVFRNAMTSAPNEPGVYRVFNRNDEIIYVGKAKNLKMRMASYLTENAKDSDKVRRMLREAKSVEWETATSEIHALLKELQLIRYHKPEFNSLLVNTRRFPFIKISAGEAFGRLDIVYELGKDGKYFGPFESSYVAEQVLTAADRYFKLVKCDKDFTTRSEPCLYFHIGRCLAPCGGDVSTEEYQEEVDAAEEFLGGSFDKLTTDLRLRLDELSKKLEFEDAADTRDLIEVLELTSLRLRLLNGPITDENFICGWKQENRFELYRIGKGLVTGPIVSAEKDLEAGLNLLMGETSVTTLDYVPLRLILNYSLRNATGFLKVDLNGERGAQEIVHKIKTAAGI